MQFTEIASKNGDKMRSRTAIARLIHIVFTSVVVKNNLRLPLSEKQGFSFYYEVIGEGNVFFPDILP